MNRYESLGITKDINNGIRKYLSTYMPIIPNYPGDVYIISDVSTTLTKLAYEYYSDVTSWPIIAKANNLSNGTVVIPPGVQIRIPDPNEVSNIRRIIKQSNTERL